MLTFTLEQVQMSNGGVGPVGGVSSFGYSGTIAHVLLQSAPGGATLAVGGGAAPLRFQRRAFSWTTAAAPEALGASAIALYSVAWAELAALHASSPGGQWLAMQPSGASGVAARAMRAALTARARPMSEPLGGGLEGRAWRGVALLLDAADGVAPCVRGVQSAVRLAQLLSRTAPPPPLLLLTSGVVAAWCGACLLYTSPSPRDRTRSRMPSSA